MTATGITWPVKFPSLGEELLRYANQSGIHMFQNNDKNLTLIGNEDQGSITLVFYFEKECFHFQLKKWFWSIPLVRWIFVQWLIN